MFDPTTQRHPGDQHLHGVQNEPSEKATLAEFPFCYNNIVQKGQVALQPNIENNKSLYVLDASQTLNPSYTIANQISLPDNNKIDQTYKCDICGLVFASIPLLNHHRKNHSNSTISLSDRVFACDVCGATFTQLCEMKAHLQTAHITNKCCNTHVGCDLVSDKRSKCTEATNFDLNDVSISGKNQSYNQQPLTRDAWTGTDDSSSQTVTKKVQPKKKTLATITKCGGCNGTGLIVIGNDQNSTKKPYQCNFCHSTFSRYSSLWSHKRLHSGEKPFKCNLCNSTFARASSLKNHNRVHTGERPYKCNICGMQFSQAHHLKSHERIHSGERPYECEVCGKAFARHSTLWNHRRIHTGEKPYKCTVCGTSFHQATHLKNHSKIHSGLKPYKCEICTVGFSDRFTLKRHRAVHEKYGQISKDQTSQPNNSQSWEQDQSNSTNPQPHMYHSETSELDKQQPHVNEIY